MNSFFMRNEEYLRWFLVWGSQGAPGSSMLSIRFDPLPDFSSSHSFLLAVLNSVGFFHFSLKVLSDQKNENDPIYL